MTHYPVNDNKKPTNSLKKDPKKDIFSAKNDQNKRTSKTQVTDSSPKNGEPAINSKNFENFNSDTNKFSKSPPENANFAPRRAGNLPPDQHLKQLQNNVFGVLYVDPPWAYSNTASRAAAVNHYPTMSVSDLCQLPAGQLAAPDCALFMWWVPSMAREAILLCDAWGFKIKTMCAFTWAKRTKTDRTWFFGMGNYTRGNAENCLLAVRGRPKVAARNVSQLVVAPVGEHSSKPPEVRHRIEQLYPDARRVELFARDTSPGWSAWGHGVTGAAPLTFENLKIEG